MVSRMRSTSSCATTWALAVLAAMAAPAAAQLPVPLPDYTLDSVRVQVGSRASASLPSATRAVQVFTAEDIARTPARTVAELLAFAVGLDVLSRSPAQTDVAIRGGSFEQILVLVDGARVSDRQTGHFDLDLAVPLAEIERVEVLRGGASALYGPDAMTGVINIVTRRGGQGWEAAAQAGSFGTWAGHASVAGALAGLALRAGGELQQSDGHRPGTDYETILGRIAGEGALRGGSLRADLAHALRDFGAANFYAAFPSYEETRATTASLAWVPPAGAATTVEPRLHFRRHTDDFVLFRGEPERYQNVHESRQLGGELVVRHAFADALGLAAGGEAQRDRLESTNLGARSETRTALFAELAARPLGRAVLTAGARYDHHSVFGGFWAPSLAAAVWPRPELRLRLSATRGLRAPTWTERYYEDPANVGDPDLRPERSHELEAGLDVAVGAARLGLGVFRRSARDLIDWARPAAAPPTTPWRTRNVQEAVFRGIEAEAEVRDPRGGRWSGSAALLSFESSEAPGQVSKHALRPLSRTLAVTVEQPLTEGLSAFARATRARRTGEDAYLLLDARVRLQRGQGELFVEGRNLSGAVYRDAAAVAGAAPPPAAPGTLEFIAAPGRALYAGVSVRMR